MLFIIEVLCNQNNLDHAKNILKRLLAYFEVHEQNQPV